MVVPCNLLHNAGTTLRALLGTREGTLQTYQALLSGTCPAGVSQGRGTVTGELQGGVLCEALWCLLVRERGEVAHAQVYTDSTSGTLGTRRGSRRAGELHEDGDIPVVSSTGDSERFDFSASTHGLHQRFSGVMSTDNTQRCEAHVAVVSDGRFCTNTSTLQLYLTTCVFWVFLMIVSSISTGGFMRNREGITAHALTLETRDAHSGAGTLLHTGFVVVVPSLISVLYPRNKDSSSNSVQPRFSESFSFRPDHGGVSAVSNSLGDSFMTLFLRG